MFIGIRRLNRNDREKCREDVFHNFSIPFWLASVVGGLVGAPVIAVPTPVGYGAGAGGIAPLLSMLNSCAANVAVVNIDNGVGAAVVASAINRLSH